MTRESSSGHKIPKVIPGGIYLLPSLLTLTNIFCGFYSMMNVINHHTSPEASSYYIRSAFLIILAGVFDALDGRVARLTKTTSSFGAQLDSLADVISFGIAPGILVYCWALDGFKRFGWIPAFLFLACGAIRLARFNVLEDLMEYTSKRYFIGLPIPAAAGAVATMVLIKPHFESPGLLALIVLLYVYLISFLMVSKLRFRSFKDVEWHRRRPLGTLFFFLIILIIVLHEPIAILFILSCLYVASGPITYFMPQAMLEFFRRLDRLLLDVKILDDDEHEDGSVEAHEKQPDTSGPSTKSHDEYIEDESV